MEDVIKSIIEEIDKNCCVITLSDNGIGVYDDNQNMESFIEKANPLLAEHRYKLIMSNPAIAYLEVLE